MPNETSDSGIESGSEDTSLDASILENLGLAEVTEQDLKDGEDAVVDDEAKAKDADADDSNSDSPKSTDTDTDKTESDSEDASDKSDPDTKDDETTDKEESTKERKSAASSSKVDNKPPKGFVPTAALHEARGENKYLKDQIAQLQDKFDSLLVKGPSKVESTEDTKPKEFEVLSEKDYEALVEDEPAKALMYMQKLNKHQQEMFAYQQQQRDEQQASDHEAQIMSAVTDSMGKMVPGLFDEGSTVHDELVEFADSVGFTDDLFYLTNPQTQIILPGETEPLLLADQAASILSVLVEAKAKITSPKVDEKAQVKDQKALEAKIRKEVETELLAKFKTDKDGTFKSLQQLAKTRDAESFGDKVLSESQFNNLSSKDQERYLSGSE